MIIRLNYSLNLSLSLIFSEFDLFIAQIFNELFNFKTELMLIFFSYFDINDGEYV